MTPLSKKLLVSLFMVTVFIGGAPFVFAQSKGIDYVPLAPVPGLTNGTNAEGQAVTNTTTFLAGLFQMVIWLATILAVVMLVIGGIQYMTSDAWGKKNDAKNTIQNALVGLLLVISSYLIVYTINPDALKFDFLGSMEKLEIRTDTNKATGASTPTVAGVPMTAQQIIDDTNVRSALKNVNVSVNAAPCTRGEVYGCTNVNGLPANTVQGLGQLKKECGCEVVITGGTEPGAHKTHGVGKPIIDLRASDSLRSWLSKKNFLINGGNGAVVKFSNGSQASFTFERAGEGNSTGDHWHVVM